MRLAIVCLLVLFAAPATASEWQYERRDGYIIAWKVLPYAPLQPLPRVIDTPAQLPADWWDWLREQDNQCKDDVPAPYFNNITACFDQNNRR